MIFVIFFATFVVKVSGNGVRLRVLVLVQRKVFLQFRLNLFVLAVADSVVEDVEFDAVLTRNPSAFFQTQTFLAKVFCAAGGVALKLKN